MVLPLEDIKVVEFATALFGGLTGQVLGDFGADVIKVEPLEGDFFRLAKKRPAGRDSTRWLGVNRSKRSIVLNLKDPRGKDIALRLIKDADVMMHNYRQSAIKRLGLDYPSVQAINQRIIYCALYGYGETGPYAHRASGDFWVQGMGGVVESQGTRDGPPYLSGPPLADQAGPVIAAYGIMLALRVRDKHGIGQEVTTSLLDTVIFMQCSQIADYLVDGRLVVKGGRGWAGAFPMGAYPTKDGDVIPFFSGDDQWLIFCGVLGLDHLAKDPQYDTELKREERREELYRILDGAFRKKTRAEWQEAFRQAGLRCDPCLNYAELFAHPQVEANQIVRTMQHPVEGSLKLVDVPVRLKKTPGIPTRPPPVLAEHTAEVLGQLGYSTGEIRRLHQDGVVGLPEEAFPSEGGAK
ncbi:MAG: CoA transferase [Chloroflexi bacterium]|nr:CoA transferase [Chloroflexota bacterium]